MSLNKTLCKIFDKDKKGHVDLDDLMPPVVTCVCVISYLIILVYGGYVTFTTDMNVGEMNPIGTTSSIVFIGSSIIVAIVMCILVLGEISDIWEKIKYKKVIKCKITKKE